MSLTTKSQKLDDIVNDNEGFQKLGEVIGAIDCLIEIKAEESYKYNLELRDGGILIKHLTKTHLTMQKVIGLKLLIQQ